MKTQIKNISLLILPFLVLLTLCLAGYFAPSENTKGVTEVPSISLTVEGKTKDASLPLVLSNLPHGTSVTVSFSLPEEAGSTLFFGSVYAPLTIKANGKVIYTYGKEGTYPPFLGDPPTLYDCVSLPAGTVREIEMHYLSPRERSTLSIHAPVAGSTNEVLSYLFTHWGLSMVIARFFLFLGLVLILLSLFFLSQTQEYKMFLLPGFLCLSAGSWQTGENSLCVYLLRNPSLNYCLDFLGLFFVLSPLYRMALYFLKPKTWPILKVILFLMRSSCFLAILLQLSGTVSFHKSLYYFHGLLPLAMLCLTLCTLYEYLLCHNQMAGKFFFPFLILAIATGLELLNYHVHFLPQFSSLFQAGLFLFVTFMAAFCGVAARDLYASRIRALSLENEVRLQEQTIAAQKKRSELLLSHFEEIRRQRHDIRHHLRSISDMLQKGDVKHASAYLGTLVDAISSYTPKDYCNNVILNATLSYYAEMAQENDIQLDIRAQIPKSSPSISDVNLCVIFGNLLENAIEACQRMHQGKKWITLRAQIRGEMLFIAMDNSYDGLVRKEGKHFLSSKSQSQGTGLTSIETLARSHQGAATFTPLENVFQSEVYFRL